MNAEASGYEYDHGEPDDLVRRSVAVVVAQVIGFGEPERFTVQGERADDDTAELEFVNDVVVPVSVRIDEVLAGIAVEAGGEYVLETSAWVYDDMLFEFEESQMPLLGESYLFFVMVNRVQDAPVIGGTLKTTAAGDGRVLLSDADAAGMLDPDRWLNVLGTDFDSDYAAELRAAGLLP